VAPLASVVVMVRLLLPVLLGVPLIRPEAGFRVRPLGRLPLVML